MTPFSLLGIIVIALLLFIYPFTRGMSQLKFQGEVKTGAIDGKNITNVTYHKDYKLGGYSILVEYDGNTKHLYCYNYKPFVIKPDGVHFHYLQRTEAADYIEY